MGKISKKAWGNINNKEAFINFMDGKDLEFLNIQWQRIGWQPVVGEPRWDATHLIYRVKV